MEKSDFHGYNLQGLQQGAKGSHSVYPSALKLEAANKDRILGLRQPAANK